MLYSECERIVYFFELTIPFEDAIEEAFERKKLKYAVLAVEVRERGGQAHTRPVEIGARGFVAKSATLLLLDLVFRGWSVNGMSYSLRCRKKVLKQVLANYWLSQLSSTRGVDRWLKPLSVG